MWASTSSRAVAVVLVACSSSSPEARPHALPEAAHARSLTNLGTRDRATLEAGLEALLASDVSGWSAEARVLLQNDAWGLWQRARDQDEGRLRRLAAHAVGQLALPAAALRALAPTASPLPRALPPSEGWEELEAEVPVLAHERAFGLRRVFRVLLAGPTGPAGPPRRALTSQLVALDDQGRAHLTRLPGELEALRFEGSTLAEARVLELHRDALLRGAPPLRPATDVAHVPGLGANAFLFELDPPEPLRDLPCARCHDDGTMMSLPTTAYPPGHRFPALLARASEEGRRVVAEARRAMR